MTEGLQLQAQTTSAVEAAFVRWFRRSGGWLDHRCRIEPIAGMGRGMVALAPIKTGETLFVIPRHLLLNLNTASLPLRVADHPKAKTKWDEIVSLGWVPLILAMMYERRLAAYSAADADASMDDINTSEGTNEEGEPLRHEPRPAGKQRWGPYLDIMPEQFSTPMFWSQEDLQALQGTSIADKIARDEVERDYHAHVRPFIKAHPDLFMLGSNPTDEQLDRWYSLDTYHVMGSRILSRSFNVKSRKASKDDEAVGMDGEDAESGDEEAEVLEEEQEGEPQDDADLSMASAKTAGEEGAEEDAKEDNDDEDEDDDEDDDEDEEDDEEQVADISMTPMADMLNARFESDNARLFYKRHVLEMRATKDIEAGAQIFNTYADPPNSDLLRRYGHVDEPNGSDVVELEASLLVTAASKLVGGKLGQDVAAEMASRLEWACSSLGIEECFAITYLFQPSQSAPHRPEPERPTPKQLKAAATGGGIDEEMVALARILAMSQDAFDRAKQKGKGPSARVEAVEDHQVRNKRVGIPVAQVLIDAIDLRLAQLPNGQAVLEDEAKLYGKRTNEVPNENHRLALVVRLGEKRVLLDQKRVLKYVLERVQENEKSKCSTQKVPQKRKR